MHKQEQLILSNYNIQTERNRIKTYEEDKIYYIGKISEIEKRVSQLKRENEELKENTSIKNIIKNSRIPTEFHRDLNIFIKQYLSNKHNHFKSEKIRGEQYKTSLANLNTKLEMANKKLLAFLKKYPEKKILLNDLIISLYDNPNIDLSSINFYEDIVEFKFINLICTVNLPKNDYFKNLDNNLQFKLPDINVSLNPTSGRVYLYNGSAEHLPRAFKGYRKPHPHIMGGDHPCLGDFEPAIIDARDNQDVNTMIEIIQLFLEQNNYDDAAGKFYPRYAIASHLNWKHSEYDAVIDNLKNTNINGSFFVYGYRTNTSGNTEYLAPILKNGVLKWTTPTSSSYEMVSMLEREYFHKQKEPIEINPKDPITNFPPPPPPQILFNNDERVLFNNDGRAEDIDF